MYFFVLEFRKLKICMQAPFVIVQGGFQFHWGGTTLTPPALGAPSTLKVKCLKSRHV